MKMENKILGLLAIVLFLLSFALVSAHGEEDIANPDHHDSMMGSSFWQYGLFGGFGFMWIFMILIIIALVLLIIWLIKQIQKDERRR
jgi:putative copper export protein